MSTVNGNPTLNPLVWFFPEKGNPTRRTLSNATFYFNGEGFSVLSTGIPEQLPFHRTPVTVDPENLPKNMRGFWKGFGTEGTSDPQTKWVMDLCVVFDGLLKTSVRNESAPEYLGDVFIVKRLYNTQTCSEVAFDIEATDLAAVQARFPLLVTIPCSENRPL